MMTDLLNMPHDLLPIAVICVLWESLLECRIDFVPEEAVAVLKDKSKFVVKCVFTEEFLLISS